MAYIPGGKREYVPSTGLKNPYIAEDLQALVDKVGPEHTPTAVAMDIDWDKVRAERNQKLTDTDWVNTGAIPMTFEERSSLYKYRQALRDMTTKSSVEWPEIPEVVQRYNNQQKGEPHGLCQS